MAIKYLQSRYYVTIGARKEGDIEYGLPIDIENVLISQGCAEKVYVEVQEDNTESKPGKKKKVDEDAPAE